MCAYWPIPGDLNQAVNDAFDAAGGKDKLANQRRPPKPKKPCGCK